jgi:hypothetical protein
MSDQADEWMPDDTTGWFDDGTYKFRLFVEPAQFPIGQVIGLETTNFQSSAGRELAEDRVGRRRDKAADQDPRWQVVVARKSRTALIRIPGVVFAETVESAAAAESRRRALLASWSPGRSYLGVDRQSFRSLRRWIRQTPGCATMPTKSNSSS